MRDSVVIVGSGMMGSSIGAISALAGNKTILVDLDSEKAAQGREKALSCIRQRTDHELNTPQEGILAEALLSCDSDLQRAAPKARFVIEAIVEQVNAKQKLFQQLDELLPASVPICSNTSGLRITDIGAGCKHPERTVTTHFWLPGHLVPLVEVVMGERTSEEIAAATKKELLRWGKKPVLVKRDLPGQLANRIFQAIIRESIDIVASGLASAEDVDTAVSCGMAMRFPEWGPLKHLDAIGLDLGLSVQETVLPNICDSRHASLFLKQLVERGNLGVKTGKGFYDWNTHNIETSIDKRDQFIIEAAKIISKLEKEFQ